MKKQLLNLGKALTKAEQKKVNGGDNPPGLAGGCTVTCNSGSEYSISNCDAAPDGACHSTGWRICSCLN